MVFDVPSVLPSAGGKGERERPCARTWLSDSQRARLGTRQTRSGSQRVHGMSRQMNCDCLLIAWSPNSAGAPIRPAACLLVSADADVSTWTDKNAARVSLRIPGRAVFSPTLARQETEKKEISALSFTWRDSEILENSPEYIGCYNVKQCRRIPLLQFSDVFSIKVVKV